MDNAAATVTGSQGNAVPGERVASLLRDVEQLEPLAAAAGMDRDFLRESRSRIALLIRSPHHAERLSAVLRSRTVRNGERATRAR
jgi:hypothetical protein